MINYFLIGLYPPNKLDLMINSLGGPVGVRYKKCVLYICIRMSGLLSKLWIISREGLLEKY